jgi:sugar transferase (PEP-CTERM/EpsH1 system associated)
MKLIKEDLLLLVHRIPYPPNKGDKIRSYHLLRHLAQRYTVHLGTFIDDENDLQYIDTVKAWCGDSHFIRLNPRLAKFGSLTALLNKRPLSLDYYRSAEMQDWVDGIVKKHAIQRVMIFSSVMAQFTEHVTAARRVIDFVDIDSDKWRQYADKKSWPMSWLYRREGQCLLSYERKLACAYDASLFVSQAEADLFKQLAPESVAKIGYFNNGVDTEYFSPDLPHDNPYSTNEKVMVFTGAMDYWPNIDAVQWFVSEVFPGVRQRHPRALFYIVGSRPSEQVLALASIEGVRVTGSVPDVRPYLAYAQVAVAPLRIARGIQNKVLEAMAMAKVVVVSAQALEGISVKSGEGLLLAESASQFIDTLADVLNQATPKIETLARHKVNTLYDWNSNLLAVDRLLELDF